MKTVRCKNCGAVFDEDLEKCPYCGTMNRKGAYRAFRLKAASMIDQVLGLKDDIQRSVSQTIRIALFRSVVIIVLITGLAFVFARFANVNYYNDKEYDRKAYEEIVWLDENLDALDQAYESDDLETIGKLYIDNAHAVMNWPLYPSFCLKKEYERIKKDDAMDEFLLRDIIYFCCAPAVYAGRGDMNKVDPDFYQEMRGDLLEKAGEAGYTEEELEDIFAHTSGEFNYIDLEKLREYLKEDGDGKL